MQFAEDHSDRRAADAVRRRIDWKYALGLEPDDPGFDPATNRLIERDDALLRVAISETVVGVGYVSEDTSSPGRSPKENCDESGGKF
jgi:hypothetical protein